MPVKPRMRGGTALPHGVQKDRVTYPKVNVLLSGVCHIKQVKK